MDRYQPGNYRFICQVCGFEYRWTQIKKRWDGLWVCEKDYEERHPQDFVRGRKETLSVPESSPDITIQERTTTLASSASEDDLSVTVSSASLIAEYESIGITLDNGIVQWTFVPADGVSGTTITLNDRLIGDAAAGNSVLVMDGDYFQTSAVSADDL